MNAETTLILVVHAAATWGMTGLIWFVQLVHYPAYRDVGPADFVAYQARHQRHTSWVVGPLMLTEIACATWLLWHPPSGIASAWLWLGAALIAVAWASTAFLQVPLHVRLSAGHDPLSIERLIRSNWVRTAAWTLRAVIAARLLLPQ